MPSSMFITGFFLLLFLSRHAASHTFTETIVEHKLQAKPLRQRRLVQASGYFPPISPFSGNTFDECRSTIDCNGDRQCLTLDNEPCSPSSNCFCTPSSLVFCLSKSDCSPGEVCADNDLFLRRVCASRNALSFNIFRQAGSPPSPPGDGLGLSPCADNSQCQGSRTCTFLYGDPFVQPCGGRQPCFCTPSPVRSCFVSEDCPEGEVCANTPITTTPICVSEEAEDDLLSVQEVPIAVSSSSGFTLDPCRSNSQCSGNRICVRFVANLPLCEGEGPCICLPPTFPSCSSSGDCVQEEVCAQTPFFGSTLCVSLDVRSAYGDVDTVATPIECPTLINEDPPVRTLFERKRELSGLDMGERLTHSFSNSSFDLTIPTAVSIAGGRAANENLLRRIVAITDNEGLCSGVLISSKWVITAAHCQFDTGAVASFLSKVAFDGSGATRTITRCFPHPKFRIFGAGFEFDVAVCELASDAPSGAIPTTLNCNGKVPKDNEPVRAAGYGAVVFRTGTDRLLRQVDIRVVSKRRCSAVYRERSFRGRAAGVFGQICAGSIPRGGCGTCQGDSGGPLLTYVGGEPIVIGLTSFGVRSCGDWDFPEVYARVSTFISWIENETPAVFSTGRCGRGPGECEPGQILQGRTCSPCPESAVSQGGRSRRCKSCRRGLVRDSLDGSSCSCKGKFAVGKGLQGRRCVTCAPGSFAGENDESCRSCSAGTNSGSGAEQCS